MNKDKSKKTRKMMMSTVGINGYSLENFPLLRFSCRSRLHSIVVSFLLCIIPDFLSGNQLFGLFTSFATSSPLSTALCYFFLSIWFTYYNSLRSLTYCFKFLKQHNNVLRNTNNVRDANSYSFDHSIIYSLEY